MYTDPSLQQYNQCAMEFHTADISAHPSTYTNMPIDSLTHSLTLPNLAITSPLHRLILLSASTCTFITDPPCFIPYPQPVSLPFTLPTTPTIESSTAITTQTHVPICLSVDSGLLNFVLHLDHAHHLIHLQLIDAKPWHEWLHTNSIYPLPSSSIIFYHGNLCDYLKLPSAPTTIHGLDATCLHHITPEQLWWLTNILTIISNTQLHAGLQSFCLVIPITGLFGDHTNLSTTTTSHLSPALWDLLCGTITASLCGDATNSSHWITIATH